MRICPGPLILQHALDGVDADFVDTIELWQLALEDIHISTGGAYDDDA